MPRIEAGDPLVRFRPLKVALQLVDVVLRLPVQRKEGDVRAAECPRDQQHLQPSAVKALTTHRPVYYLSDSLYVKYTGVRESDFTAAG